MKKTRDIDPVGKGNRASVHGFYWSSSLKRYNCIYDSLPTKRERINEICCRLSGQPVMLPGYMRIQVNIKQFGCERRFASGTRYLQMMIKDDRKPKRMGCYKETETIQGNIAGILFNWGSYCLVTLVEQDRPVVEMLQTYSSCPMVVYIRELFTSRDIEGEVDIQDGIRCHEDMRGHLV